jgi:hypothetical protein
MSVGIGRLEQPSPVRRFSPNTMMYMTCTSQFVHV